MALMERAGGIATTAQLLTVMTRQQLDVQVRKGNLVRVWHGVYATCQPDLLGRLAALDLFMGQEAVCCLGTAAALYGFDMQNSTAIHVLDPGVRMRPTTGLMVHQRVGAPLQRVAGRLATSAGDGRRLKSPGTLSAAASARGARRRLAFEAVHTWPTWRRRGSTSSGAAAGIVGSDASSLAHADARAESAMESEARLVMHRRRPAAPRAPVRDHRPLRMANCGGSTSHGPTRCAWQPSTTASQWHAGPG